MVYYPTYLEGQGVVVEGFIVNEGFFNAKTVLAKHDENYMPPEIKEIESIKEKLMISEIGLIFNSYLCYIKF